MSIHANREDHLWATVPFVLKAAKAFLEKMAFVLYQIFSSKTKDDTQTSG